MDPGVSRDELAVLIGGSTVEIGGDEHLLVHSAAGDFARWGRLGGLKPLALYGPGWFVLLKKRRWERSPQSRSPNSTKRASGRRASP